MKPIASMSKLIASLTVSILVFAGSVSNAQSGRVDTAVADSTPEISPPAEISLPPELDRVLRDYEEGWRSRDADALAALFSPSGFILRPGHAPVRGREAIAKAYENSGGPLHLRAFEYAIEDAVAYIIGGYSQDPDAPDSGKYILTLVKLEDGRWYITADMDNSNR